MEIADDLSVLDSIFVPAVTNIYLVGPPLAKHTDSWIVELTQGLSYKIIIGNSIN